MKSIPLRVRAAGSGTPGGAAPRWRLSWLLAAPHRLGFFAGALMFGATALWWAAVIALREVAGAWLPWAVSPGLAHGLLFGFGFLPLFFAGFLFTAGPRWLGLPPVEARALLPAISASLAGWGVFALGAHAAAPLAAFGLVAVASGWGVFTLRFWRLLRASAAADRTHARVIAVACGVGVLAMLGSAGGVAAGREDLARAALQMGLWGFVGIVCVTVAHRMIPFFTASALPRLDAWRPTWLLWTFVTLLAAQVPLAWAGLWIWPWPAALRAVQVGLDVSGAVLLLGLALRWGLVQSLRIRLLAMLHIGFVWLGIAFALSALSHALIAATDGTVSLGLAPQHALTMGFYGSLLLAMATRVASGHGGRTLAADDLVWCLFWCLQGAVLLRVLAALWPPAQGALLVAAALAWALAALGWALRYGRWFGRPRADGQPG